MKPHHSHIQREQAEIRRLMQNFNPTASKEARAGIQREMEWQKERFLALERVRHREQQRRRGLSR